MERDINMAMKKEALTNLIADDLANRNDNWTEIDTTFGLKADKTYVDNQNAALTAQLADIEQNIASGLEIADNSVTYEKTTFLETERINLINPDLVTVGKYLNSSGVLATNANYSASDYIPVIQGEKIYTNTTIAPAYAWFYTSEFVLVSVASKNLDGIITVPADDTIAYIRTSWPNTLTTPMLAKTALPLSYVPYSAYKVNITDQAFEDKISELIATENIFKELHVNLVDVTTMTNGKYINASTGTLATNLVFNATDFIECEAGKGYYGNHYSTNYGAYYDENKAYISSIGTSISYFEPTVGAKYVRLTYLSNEPTPYLIEGSTAPNQIPTYSEVKIVPKTVNYRDNLKNDIVKHPLYKMKWNALGDSITHAPGKTRNYHSIIARETGVFVRNYGVSGSRISLGDGGTAGNEMSTRYVSMDDNADIVTVMGGINDMNNLLTLGVMSDRAITTFYGALHVLLKGLHTKYMGKRIGFISPINYGNTAHEPYQQAIREVCRYYSIPLLDLSKDGLINTVIPEIQANFISDGLHPDETGHDVLARKIKQFLLTL